MSKAEMTRTQGCGDSTGNRKVCPIDYRLSDYLKTILTLYQVHYFVISSFPTGRPISSRVSPPCVYDIKITRRISERGSRWTHQNHITLRTAPYECVVLHGLGHRPKKASHDHQNTKYVWHNHGDVVKKRRGAWRAETCATAGTNPPAVPIIECSSGSLGRPQTPRKRSRSVGRNSQGSMCASTPQQRDPSPFQLEMTCQLGYTGLYSLFLGL